MTREAKRGDGVPADAETTGSPSGAKSPAKVRAASLAEHEAERRMSHLSALLEAVDPATAARSGSAATTSARDNELPLVRLGLAAGLFASLRAKHAETAAHSLRVTLCSSAWAQAMDLPGELCDALEVAALLHDVGKIGVPDHILLKPSSLSPEEAAVMQQHRVTGLEILRTCCENRLVLDIVGYASVWFRGDRGHGLSGDEIPLGARMLSIVDAFDAMTTNQLYRRPMSRERAIGELFRYAGTQFDPRLVEEFARFHDSDHARLQDQVAQGWLSSLRPEEVNSNWSLNDATLSPDAAGRRVYHKALLDNLQDAVAFIDNNLRVVLWNRGAERMTGISAPSILQRTWTPKALEMTEPDGRPLAPDECPVENAINSGEQFLRRLLVRGRGGRVLPVEVQVVPVEDADGTQYGATLVLRDVSPQTSLEARCQSLHEMATRDALTQVANRAEFDRVHELFVIVHLEQSLPCSLIICDIDLFKQINDNYGHPAGDEVIKNLARLLKRMSRPGDLVARYGGEEFVLLCAGCDNATAVRRAEDLRRAFAEMPQPALGTKRATASFGVTEIQPGDTPDSMLRRADRALLYAKEKGRDMVVQLGTGIAEAECAESPEQELYLAVAEIRGASAGAVGAGSESLVERLLRTSVPLEMAIEKLRGFIADHHADVVAVENGHVQLQIGGDASAMFRRGSDRPVRFVLDLSADEERADPSGGDADGPRRAIRTLLHVKINPLKGRNRRTAGALDQARRLLASLQAYLMAEPVSVRTGSSTTNSEG